MIGKTYITPNLILPFVHKQYLYYRESNELAYEFGELNVEVFVDGSCNIQVLAAGRGLVTWHSVGQFLTSDMLEKLFWDSEKKAFFATFGR